MRKKVKMLSERDNIPQKSHHWCPLIKQVWCNNFSSPEILLWSLRWTSPQITQPTSFRCTLVLVLLKKGITKLNIYLTCHTNVCFKLHFHRHANPYFEVQFISLSKRRHTQSLSRCDAHLFVDVGNFLKFCNLVLVLRLWVGAQALEKFQTTDRWEENISFLFSSSEED